MSAVVKLEDAAVPADPWPEPQPLERATDRIAYPLDALPDYLADAVAEVQAYVQSPLAMVATSALGAMAIAGQAHTDVARDASLTGPTSLYTLTIADSGERKTSGEGYFTGPIAEYERDQRAAAAPELREYRSRAATWKAKSDGLLDAIRAAMKANKSTAALEREHAELIDAEPVRPRVPHLLLTDATPEGLVHSLGETWPASAIVSDEGGAVFGSHAMNRDTIMRNLSTLNTLWGAGAHRVTRRTSESYTVEGVRLSVAVQVQGATLRDFLEKNGALARGTGFLARFLICEPASTQGHRPYREPPTDWPGLARFHERLRDVLRCPVVLGERGSLSPSTLAIEGEAKAAWVEFHNAIESKLSTDGELGAVRDVASKAADNVARVAALFALFDTDAPVTRITEAHVRSAGRVVGWHLHEALRFFGEFVADDEERAATILEAWLIERCRRDGVAELARRDVQQHGPRSVRARDPLVRALERLADAGRVRLAEGERRQVRVQLHPAVLDGSAP